MSISLSNLKLNLLVDKVLSKGQIYRHYGLELNDLTDNFQLITTYLSETHHSRSFREVIFVALEGRYSRLSAHALRHLAGVAEMRLTLNACKEDWLSEAHASFTSNKPDAIWQSPLGNVAIEFDAGSYSTHTILQKITAFQGFSNQIWGSSSKKRVNRIRELLQSQSISSEVLFVDWM